MQKRIRKIKDRPISERPYEKCYQYGAQALSDGELLAVILRSGTREYSSLELAWMLLEKHPSCKGLAGLYHLGIEELMTIPGIGKVKAIEIQCVLELSRRFPRAGFSREREFTSPEEIAGCYMESMRHLNHEQVQLLLLDGKHRLLKEMVLTNGDSKSAFVPIRNIFMEALRCEAVYLILLHNHPSGCPEPSREDLVITERIREAGKLLGVTLSDHIIIGDRCFFSMKEENIL